MMLILRRAFFFAVLTALLPLTAVAQAFDTRATAAHGYRGHFLPHSIASC